MMENQELHNLVAELVDHGFTVQESMRLIVFRQTYTKDEKPEQSLSQERHLHFARWLFEHGCINEEI